MHMNWLNAADYKFTSSLVNFFLPYAVH